MVYCVYNALRVLYSSFYSSSFFLLPSSLSGVARGQRTQPLCVRRWGERAAPHAMRVCTISRPYCASRGGGWRGRRGRRGRREGGRRDCCTCDTSKNTSEHGEDGHTWARVHRILAWQPPVPPVSAYRSDRRCGRERERARERCVLMLWLMLMVYGRIQAIRDTTGTVLVLTVLTCHISFSLLPSPFFLLPSSSAEHLHAVIPGAPLSAGSALFYDTRVVRHTHTNHTCIYIQDIHKRVI